MAEDQKAQESAATQQVFPEIQCKVESSGEERLLSFAVRKPQDPAELKVKQLTVGDEFLLRCSGEAFDLKPDELKILWSNEAPQKIKDYALEIVEVHTNTASEIVFKAKTFIAGKQQLSFLMDTGSSIYQVNKLEINSLSLLETYPQGYKDPNETQLLEQAEKGLQQFMQNQQPKPFPAMSGVQVAYPMYLWAVLAAVLLMAMAALFAVFQTRKRKRKLMDRWESLKSPIGSHKDFHKTLRRKERAWYSGEMKDDEIMDGLYSEIRLFFFREYKLNDEKKNHSHILDFFKKDKTTKDSRLRRLKILLDELEKGAKAEELNEADIKDYIKRSRELVDHLYMKGGL